VDFDASRLIAKRQILDQNKPKKVRPKKVIGANLLERPAKRPKQHEEDRVCKICGNELSIYNKGDVCHKHRKEMTGV